MVTGVADRVPEKIKALVYVDAFILENGESLDKTAPPPAVSALIEAATRVGEGWKVPPMPAEALHVNTSDVEWVNRQCTMHPLSCFQQSIVLSGGIDRVDGTFVLATGYEPSPFLPSYERAKKRGWNTRTMPCGHDVMLDLPDELTQVLIDACLHGKSKPV